MIEQAKNNLLSDDWDVQLKASSVLSENCTKEIFDFLIALLESKDHGIKNIVALTLRDIGDSNAVDPLMVAICYKENFNFNGTLVYALQTLDCSQKLKELFEIMFYQGYEPALMASMILDEQVFEFTKQNILDILVEWEDIKINNEKCPMYEDKKEMIQRDIDGFASYLQ